MASQGTLTEVEPGTCVRTTRYLNFNEVSSSTTGPSASWTIDGVRHVGPMSGDGLGYGPVQAVIVDGQPYLPGSFDAVSPVVGFGRWHNPLVLLVLLPLQAGLLGFYLVPPIVTWWRETPS